MFLWLWAGGLCGAGLGCSWPVGRPPGFVLVRFVASGSLYSDQDTKKPRQGEPAGDGILLVTGMSPVGIDVG